MAEPMPEWMQKMISVVPPPPDNPDVVDIPYKEGFNPDLKVYFSDADIPARRNNNPGNLMYVGQQGSVRGGSKRGGGYWAKFSSPEDGFNALIKDIEFKKQGKSKTGISGDSTIADFFKRYAPPSENDSDKYIKSVSKRLGISALAKIKDVDTQKLASEIAKHESGAKVIMNFREYIKKNK